MSTISQLRARAAKEPVGVDISDYGDEWCDGFLRGQVSILEEIERDDLLGYDALVAERDRYSEALEDIVQFEHEEMGREGHVWAVARRALNPQGHSDPSTDSEAVDSPQDPDLLSSEATAIRDAYPQAYLLGPIPFGELPQEHSNG
jgi:hypothetical protein